MNIKLTDKDKELITKALIDGQSTKELANIYNVSIRTIQRIKASVILFDTTKYNNKIGIKSSDTLKKDTELPENKELTTYLIDVLRSTGVSYKHNDLGLSSSQLYRIYCEAIRQGNTNAPKGYSNKNKFFKYINHYLQSEPLVYYGSREIYSFIFRRDIVRNVWIYKPFYDEVEYTVYNPYGNIINYAYIANEYKTKEYERRFFGDLSYLVKSNDKGKVLYIIEYKWNYNKERWKTRRLKALPIKEKKP